MLSCQGSIPKRCGSVRRVPFLKNNSHVRQLLIEYFPLKSFTFCGISLPGLKNKYHRLSGEKNTLELAMPFQDVLLHNFLVCYRMIYDITE